MQRLHLDRSQEKIREVLMKTLKVCNSLPVSRKQARMLESNIRLDILYIYSWQACDGTQQRKAVGCGSLMVHTILLREFKAGAAEL